MNPVKNPFLYSDFPDVDIIRVDDTYYMVTTTMYFMPGGDLLRSYDLIHWEFVTHIFDSLEDNDAHRLRDGKHIYGRGMWAPSLRYHKGCFYLVFAANDSHKTYLFTSTTPEGPWKKGYIEGFYHDASLFFDDDDRVYLITGNRSIRLLELKSDLSGPKEGGLDRILIRDRDDVGLGYEGSHLYKKGGFYYLFNIHWSFQESKRRSEVCSLSDSLEGEFISKTIIDDDFGFYNKGAAQGGMVDTPNGGWYVFMFQDRGAVGRTPVLFPMHFEDNFPVVGIPLEEISEEAREEHLSDRYHINLYLPREMQVPSTRPDYKYAPINGDDDFNYIPNLDGSVCLKPFWQFNHLPDDKTISFTKRKGAYRIYTDTLAPTLVLAKNTLTQRTIGPKCAAIVTLDASNIKDGDYAALCTLQGAYGLIAVTRREGNFYLVMQGYEYEMKEGRPVPDPAKLPKEYACIPLSSPIVKLKAVGDFTELTDKANFFYAEEGTDEFKPLGITHQLYFHLDHFTGCRFGLSYFSTKESGGFADFMKFQFLPL